jgi:1-acyl-sn-glycerol-3-phosphate acyltransferase
LLKHVTKVLGITWELRGREHLAEERGCVIAANHQSILDVLGEKLIVDRRPICLTTGIVASKLSATDLPIHTLNRFIFDFD